MESDGGRGCFSCFLLVVFIVTIWAGTSISRSAPRTKKILQDLSCKKGRGADLFIRYWRRCDFSLYGTFTAEIVPLRGGLCRWRNFSVAAKNSLGGFCVSFRCRVSLCIIPTYVLTTGGAKLHRAIGTTNNGAALLCTFIFCVLKKNNYSF